MIKKIAYIIMLLLLTVTVNAQNAKPNGKKFDPAKFMQEQEAFITKEAKQLSFSVGAKKWAEEMVKIANSGIKIFYTVHGDSLKRLEFHKQRKYAKSKPQNDKEAAKTIAEIDKTELQIKKLQTDYHNKFCKVIPATKVFQCLQAEERFKHHIMDKMANRRPNKNKHADKGKKK